ncbi:MAG: ATP-binding protein [Gammaproteobacteria bacterium]|nr:ATP-binding protein [Gammaproteobacteria bacterium]
MKIHESSLELTLKNELSEIERAAGVINEHGHSHEWPDEWLYRINVSVDELITNTVNYSYADEDTHSILLMLVATHDKLMVTIEDDGRPFNPFEKVQPPDHIEDSLEDRPIGGLGVHLVKALMDEFSYERTADGLNRITLVQLRESQDEGHASPGRVE